jgi:hypothetical protein
MPSTTTNPHWRRFAQEPPPPVVSGHPVNMLLEKAHHYFAVSGRAGVVLEESFYGREQKVPAEVIYQLSCMLDYDCDDQDKCRKLAETLDARVARLNSASAPADERVGAETKESAKEWERKIARLQKGAMFLRAAANGAYPGLLNDLRKHGRGAKISESAQIERQLENACTRETVYTLRAPLLFKASVALKLQGLTSQIFQALADLLKQHRSVVSGWPQGETNEEKKERQQRLVRIDKAINQLENPKPVVVKEFELMRQGAAVQTEHDNAATAPLALPMAQQQLALAGPSGSAPPPLPLALPAPTQAPTLYEYCRPHVVPRPDCAKCEVARGLDASVRAEFASDGGTGKVRDVSRKRACPLAAHAISAARDGVPLVEQYERDHGVKIAHKKQKFMAFMRDVHGVEPYGPRPSHRVTLYKTVTGGAGSVGGGVGVSLALEGGEVKLDLSSFSYEKASESTDNYGGFMIV